MACMHARIHQATCRGRFDADLALGGDGPAPELNDDVGADGQEEDDLQHQAHLSPCGAVQLHLQCVNGVVYLQGRRGNTIV